MNLTPSQQKALDQTKHLAIVANAGSGKTRVLVKRYVQILLDHPELSPRNIVAITFTEAAAAELRTRIANEIDDRIKALGKESSPERSTLIRIRNGLASAYISTIHAFALRIIRAYPVEANVDATFGTLTDTDRDVVLEDAIQSVLERTLTAAYADPDPENAMLNTFRILGRKELERVMERMIGSRWKADELRKALVNASDEAFVEEWEGYLHKLLSDIPARQLPLIERVLEYPTSKGAIRGAIEEAINAIAAARNWFERIREYSVAYHKVITGDGNISGHLLKKDKHTSETDSLAEQLDKVHEPLTSLLDELPTETDFHESHQKYTTILRSVVTLYSDVEQVYAEAKAKYSVLDFDDLIDRLAKLLERQDIAEELSEDFAYILIDEYQDTDEVQFEIAQSLTRNFGPQNKLAIVGDPKQSIYSFRNADIRTFNLTKERILSQVAYGNDEERGLITLAESFRMADRPLAFINYSFGEILKSEFVTPLAVEQTPYEDLVAARSPQTIGSVEWLIHNISKEEKEHEFEEKESESEDGTNDGSLDGEMSLIAAKIREIVDNASGKYDISREHKNLDEAPPSSQPQFRDIVILLKERKRLSVLEQALTHFQVPYNVARGVGFFEQQEVVDLVSYLKFLVRPNDDLALLAILRSPIFAISDTAIFEMHVANSNDRAAGEKTHRTFWEKLLRYTELHPDANALLLRACNELKENLALAGRIPTSAMLEKILRDSALEATYSALPNGAQAIANLHKLINIVRSYDVRSFTTMYDCVEKLKDRINRQDRESQAPTSDENAVRIMTIHGAKGLEFPIVIVADLGRPKRSNSDVLIDPQFGIRFSSSDAPKPLVTELLKLTEDAKSLEETKRILYVALTRARDHLILSATLKNEHVQKNSLLQLFGDRVKQTLCDPEATGMGIVADVERYDALNATTSIETHTWSAPITRSLDGITFQELVRDEALESAPTEYHLQKYNAPEGLGRFSPTQLLSFAECPTKYFLRYVLGLPEDVRLQYDLETDELAERVQGTVLGQLIHKLFEHLNRFATASSIDHSAFEHEFGKLAQNLGILPEEEKPYYDEALNAVERFLQHELFSLVQNEGAAHTEFMIQATISNTNLLRGIIDRLTIKENGDVHILDYKTDRITGSENPAKQARYKFQMRFYAFLASLAYPNAAKITTTLYYTRYGSTEEYHFDRSSFDGIESEVTGMIERIRALENVRDLKKIDRNIEHCPECAFFDREVRECSVVVADQKPIEIPARYPSS